MSPVLSHLPTLSRLEHHFSCIRRHTHHPVSPDSCHQGQPHPCQPHAALENRPPPENGFFCADLVDTARNNSAVGRCVYEVDEVGQQRCPDGLERGGYDLSDV